MRPQIVPCVMLALALSLSQASASKLIGNGFLPDGRDCVVGTSKDCQPKEGWESIKVVADGVMPKGGDCILGTAEHCTAKQATAGSQGTLKGVTAIVGAAQIKP